MKKEARYLVSVIIRQTLPCTVFGDRLYIYPSHDWEAAIPENLTMGITLT